MDPLESRILDVNSGHLGVSADTLMDNAGRALADHILREFDDPKVLVVCGNGDNGGDGLAAAYHLRDRTKVTVALLNPPEMIGTETARKRLSMLRSRPKLFSDVFLGDYDVILDCVLGIGARGEPRADVRRYLEDLRLFKGSVVSADVPTGMGTDLAFVPHSTVTFHDVKTGMTPENSGRIVIADIGIPKGSYETVGPGDMLRYPVPDEDSHKGQNGRVLVIGGGPYVGAPAMSAMAALRTGADIVRIATPSRSFPAVSCMSPSFIVHELPGEVLDVSHVGMLEDLAGQADAVVIGPGLGRDPRTMDAVRSFLGGCRIPAVIDADAIAAFGGPPVPLGCGAVFTPHGGEIGIVDRTDVFGLGDVTVLRKGRTDVIRTADRTRNNVTGTAGMTVGGTGDALAGVVGALLAKGMGCFDAACLGAYINGKAGERAFGSHSYGMTATDLIECIPSVLKEHLG